MPALRKIIDLSLQISPADPFFIEGEHHFFARHEIKAHGIIRVVLRNRWFARNRKIMMFLRDCEISRFSELFRSADTAGAAAEFTTISLYWTEMV